MQDSNRLQRISDKLNELWKKYPELRFCQLIHILMSQIPETHKTYGNGLDIFNINDETFENLLDKTTKEGLPDN